MDKMDTVGTMDRPQEDGIAEFSFYREDGLCWYAPLSGTAFDAVPSDTMDDGSRSELVVTEDGVPLPRPHAPHVDIRKLGYGRFSHWNDSVRFAPSDNSNPLLNGRRYEVRAGALAARLVPSASLGSAEEIERQLAELRPAAAAAERERRAAVPVNSIHDLWRLHPQGEYLLARGGDAVAPPVYCNITLTNKCNLRCAICGSQKALDDTKTARSHMPLEVFNRVAETVFPFVVEVEMNSQGDPLVYPHIEAVMDAIQRHRCQFRLQTNGTLFTDPLIERLVSMHGTIYMSIDAVGPLFNQVRYRGVWDKADPMIRKVARLRDPETVSIRLYPTMTRRTVGDMMNVVRWAAELGLDTVDFHIYSPIGGGSEEVPSDDEIARQRDLIADWIARENPGVGVAIGTETLSPALPRTRRFASPEKIRFINGNPLFPIEAEHPSAVKSHLCLAPLRQLDIGLRGQVSVCCRTQHEPLGYVSSVEAFADLWFGRNLTNLRESLRREDLGSLPLPGCESCIQQYTPQLAQGRKAVRYGGGRSDDPRGLDYPWEVADPVLVLRHSAGSNAYRARIPYGIGGDAFELCEDGRPLSHPGSSIDDIQASGAGRYLIADGDLYFSASDNTDPLRNDRRYEVRRRSR